MLLKNRFSTMSLRWFHWLVVIASLLLTIAAWKITKIQIEEKLEQRFRMHVNQLVGLLTEQMTHYEAVLQTGAALIHTHNNKMDSETWRVYTTALDLNTTYNGIYGMGLIRSIESDQLDDFIVEQQRTRPEFRLQLNPDRHGEQLDSAKQQTEHWPVVFVEPQSANSASVGLDIAFETKRLNAAKLARDTGVTQITAPIHLVQDQNQSPGFLQFVPFYSKVGLTSVAERQAAFIGHVYAPFIVSDLMEGVLQSQQRYLFFKLSDNGETLYDEFIQGNDALDPMPLFERKVSVDMYGRLWEFHLQTSLMFRSGAHLYLPTYILIGGLLIDVFIMCLIAALTHSNKSAMKLTSDVSRRLAMSESYFRHIIEAAPCGIIVVSESGIIERINSQAAELFHYTEHAFIGMQVDALVPERYRHVHPGHRQSFWDNPSHRQMGVGREIFALCKDGREFPAEIGLAQINTEHGKKSIVTIIDITSSVQITNELKRSNKELNDFAYVASHDLKAPLRGIMQLADWVIEDLEGIATEEVQHHLQLIIQRTTRLENLLDDLLSYSRVGRNIGDAKRVDTKALVADTFALLDPPQGFSLVFQGNMPVPLTYKVPLEVVFRNLLNNAIKHHNKQQGTIIVGARKYENGYEFSVTDDGPGIAPRHQEQVFELFKTLRPRDEVEGSGMGLAIIKKMLDYHGGNISVLSDGHQGCCFTFTWPNIANKREG